MTSTEISDRINELMAETWEDLDELMAEREELDALAPMERIRDELMAESEELDALEAMYRISERRLTMWRSYLSDVSDALDMVESLEAMQERVLTGEEQPGLTEEEINLLPTRMFSSQGQEPGDATRGGEQEIEQCQICLLDLEDGDTLRCIPCIHHFHSHCLDEWVKRHATCPSCRQDLRPQRHD